MLIIIPFVKLFPYFSSSICPPSLAPSLPSPPLSLSPLIIIIIICMLNLFSSQNAHENGFFLYSLFSSHLFTFPSLSLLFLSLSMPTKNAGQPHFFTNFLNSSQPPSQSSSFSRKTSRNSFFVLSILFCLRKLKCPFCFSDDSVS